MRKIVLFLVFLFAVCLSSNGQAVPGIDVKTNKSPLSYKVNEEMIYTFQAVLKGISPEGLFIRYNGQDDAGKKYSGQVPAAEKLVIKTSLDRPGFVNINAELVNAKGEVIFAGGRYIRIYCGTAAEPEKLTDCGEPADFDKFWAGQRKKLDAVPFAGKEEMVKVRNRNGVDFYAVKIPCAGPRPVTGYLGIPANAAAKSLPAEIRFFGYGTHIQNCPADMPGDRITLQINAHGQELRQSAEYYKTFFQSIRSNGHSYAFDPVQNSDPETAFFNGMALRVMRALDFLKCLPQWNGKDLTAVGGSQGGLQVMWAAALDPDVSEAYPGITWCCDMAGQSKKGRAHGAWRMQYTPALDYYDPVFMAKRIKKAKVVITRAGLGDYTCPPSGLAICYKNLATPNKMIAWMQKSDHGYIPENPEIVFWAERDFVSAIFNGSTDKPALSYKINEPMKYKFRVNLRGIDTSNMVIRCSRRGDDGKTAVWSGRADQEMIIETSLDRPGFVNIDAELVDKQGKAIMFGRRKAGYYAGTAVEPESLTDCGEPADFDEFWARQRKKLDAVPFAGKVEMVKFLSAGNGVDCYAVKIPCASPRPVTGYLSIPRNAAAKSLPAEIHFIGYGDHIQGRPGGGPPDRIYFRINAHGQELGQSSEYYKKFFQSIRSNGHPYAFDPVQNSDPETAFFNEMALRVMRALDFLKSLPQWNGRDLKAVGISQGGLQVMWAAALDQDVSEAYPGITWCCDLAGQSKKGRAHGPWRIKYTPALDYYDPVFMAKRIKKAKVVITRAGLGDYTCPPSGLAVCYKNLATPDKTICWYQGSHHNFIPADSVITTWSTSAE